MKTPSIYFRILFLSVLSHSLLSCDNNRGREHITEIFSSGNYENFSDSIFVSDNIKSIIYHQGDFFFLDKKAGVVTRTDRNMNYIASYGRRGRGPGETIFLESFGVGNNKIYLSGTGCCFNIFDIETGDYLETIHYDKKIGNNPITQRLLINEDSFIGSYNGEYTISGNPIVELNNGGAILHTSKGSVSGDNDKVKAMADRDLFKINPSGYISVVKNIPVIDFYNDKLQYKSTVDISKIDIIKTRLDQIEIQKKEDNNPNTAYYLFKDSYYSDGKLYILCLTENRNSINTPVACNIILKFDISSEKVRYLGAKILPDVWYNSICVTTDNTLLVAANTFGSTIETFEIKN